MAFRKRTTQSKSYRRGRLADGQRSSGNEGQFRSPQERAQQAQQAKESTLQRLRDQQKSPGVEN